MIKVMVVEDEPPILRNIAGAIEAAGPQYKITAKAESGYEAMELLRTDIPDIVFTDIQMPVVDGLELIRHIREKQLDTIVVILSGYSEFQYAREAMKLGVEDYLLKPLKTSELSVLLKKLEDRINEKKKVLERDYYSTLLVNEPGLPSAGGVDTCYDSYLVMLFCAGSFPTYSLDFYTLQRRFWNENDLEATAQQVLHPEEKVWVFDGKTGAEKVAIFTLKSSSCERASHIAKSISRLMSNTFLPLSIAVSDFTQSAQNIGALFQSMRLELSKKMIFGKSQVFEPSGNNEKTKPLKRELPVIDTMLEKRLVKYIENGSISGFKNELSNLFSQWDTSGFHQVWVDKLLKDILFLCLKKLDSSASYDTTELELQINEVLSLSSSYEELFKNVWYVFEEIFNNKLNTGTSVESVELLMKKIERYIKENLTETIDNQLLSEKFGLVPSYLSKLFRKYKGISPTDFIIHLKVQKAKELIETRPEMLLKDIASILGFCDPFHFSKVFKREIGLTPSEYKNKGC